MSKFINIWFEYSDEELILQNISIEQNDLGYEISNNSPSELVKMVCRTAITSIENNQDTINLNEMLDELKIKKSK